MFHLKKRNVIIGKRYVIIMLNRYVERKKGSCYIYSYYKSYGNFFTIGMTTLFSFPAYIYYNPALHNLIVHHLNCQ